MSLSVVLLSIIFHPFSVVRHYTLLHFQRHQFQLVHIATVLVVTLSASLLEHYQSVFMSKRRLHQTRLNLLAGYSPSGYLLTEG